MSKNMKDYLYRVMVAASMLMNVTLGGELGQTLSARQHELKRNNKWNIAHVIDMFCGKNHCSNCWSYWKVRKW